MSGRSAARLRVGLTGGIGSGKSEVARLLADLGAVVVDSDVLAREVVAPGTAGLAEVVAAFGPEVLAPDGGLDRAALARQVFSDPVARATLEGIVHPRVRRRAAEMEAAAPGDAVVVHDIPLLVETGQEDRFDVVLVVDVPEQVQVDRLRARGMAEADVRDRIASQVDRRTRLAAADVVIDNGGSRQELRARVEALWGDLVARTRR